jgi:hypothetical protein
MVCLPKGPKDLEEEKNSLEFFDRENPITLRRRRTRERSSIEKTEETCGCGETPRNLREKEKEPPAPKQDCVFLPSR